MSAARTFRLLKGDRSRPPEGGSPIFAHALDRTRAKCVQQSDGTREFIRVQMLNSTTHYLHTVGVTGSIPVAPTIAKSINVQHHSENR